MHIPRIYIPQALVENATIELESAAAHHLAKVLRMKAGQSVILFNGLSSGEYEATLSSVNKKNVSVAIGQCLERKTESPLAIELGICIIKNDRMDWLLQKATELGITSISPLWSTYTDVKIPAERLEKKIQHWRQVVINACEQSQRVCIPVVNTPQKIQPWLETVSADKKWMLHPYVPTNSDYDSKNNNNNHSKPSSIVLLVGPEGGFSDQEVNASGDQGFKTIQLGSRILRAETAPLAAITLCQYQYGDFSESIE